MIELIYNEEEKYITGEGKLSEPKNVKQIGEPREYKKIFLEDYVHISPNAALAGTVSVGEKTHIGIGAIVKNNITITSDVVIGAGAVVVQNIQEQGIYCGVPARKRD